MMIGEQRNKNTMLIGLKPGALTTRMVARNTVKATYPDGTVIIRYMDTNVVTINPDKSVILNSGGFMTKTTKIRIEENTRLRIKQDKSIWYIIRNIHQGYPMTNEGLPLFYDGIHISEKGEILSGIRVSPEATIKQFKKDLKTLTDKITKENLPDYFKDLSGDCWVCKFDNQANKATSDHLISHVKEGYMHGSLMILCLNMSGFKAQVHIQMKFVDNIKRSIRKVISETCIPVLLNNPEIYSKEI